MTNPPSFACSHRFASQSCNASRWLRHYQRNRLNRTEPEWGLPCLLAPDVRHELAVSLSHFQLGETGGGTFLIGQASKNACAEDLAALTLFVREENEHARLLACMVDRLGGTLVKRHWTQRLFKLARRAGGFHFEIQMLLTAEIIGTAYYELLHAGVEDGPITHAIGLMLRDEAGHVAFHTDRMRACWHGWLPLRAHALAGAVPGACARRATRRLAGPRPLPAQARLHLGRLRPARPPHRHRVPRRPPPRAARQRIRASLNRQQILNRLHLQAAETI